MGAQVWAAGASLRISSSLTPYASRLTIHTRACHAGVQDYESYMLATAKRARIDQAAKERWTAHEDAVIAAYVATGATGVPVMESRTDEAIRRRMHRLDLRNLVSRATRKAPPPPAST